MADKKIHVVMISSTVRDLPDHREGVKEACLRQTMFPKMMEHLPASDDGALNVSMKMVDEADVYLCILGHRYGYVPKGETKSVTHYEYDQATMRGIERIIFIMHEDHPIKARDMETGEGADKLKQLKEKLLADHVVNFFKSPEHLRELVINTLAIVKKKLTTP